MAAFSATLSTYLPKDASDVQDDYYTQTHNIVPSISPRHQLVQLLQHQDWQEAVILWGSRPLVMASTVPRLDADEIRAIFSAFEAGRDITIARGLYFRRERYAVLCYDPPLLYGRRGPVDDTEGLVIAKGRHNGIGEEVVLLVTYRPPLVSAYVVPRVIDFFHRFLGVLPLKKPPPSELFLLG